MRMRVVLSMLAGGVVVLLFQNCTPNVSFSSKDGLRQDEALVRIDDVNESDETSSAAPPPPPPTIPQTLPPTGSLPPTDADADHDNDNDNDNDDQESSSPVDDGENADWVACILKDHGKSLKLGLMTSGLVGGNSRAESVCVTRGACLGMVAEAFAVEGISEGGFCEHNPHVRRLSDVEVRALLDK